MELEVVTIIFKSTEYLFFIEDQMKRYCKNFDDISVSLRVVANDPEQKIIDALSKLTIPYVIHKNTNPKEYYINRVYRCFNYCVSSSKADLVCLINSDMGFTQNWLKPLVELHKNNYLPTSRLVESGKMPSGTHAISKYFGRSPKDFKEDQWIEYAESIKEKTFKYKGLFGPVIYDRCEFILTGMYPEGNIYIDGVGTANGHPIDVSDNHFFNKIEYLTGRKHVTSFESLVYHIQEGEKDE
jgi:hypothetical protein